MQLGMVGLGRMGSNLVRRLLPAGHECVVFDVDADMVKGLAGKGATGTGSLEELVAALCKPRAVWVLVPAGDITERTVRELYGISADIGEFTDTGMTDPEVGHKTFLAVLDREPQRKEFTRLLERRLHYLHQTVAESPGYRVLAGVSELLPKLIEDGYLLGLVTGNLEEGLPL